MISYEKFNFNFQVKHLKGLNSILAQLKSTNYMTIKTKIDNFFEVRLLYFN
jgi:hypothetical protein